MTEWANERCTAPSRPCRFGGRIAWPRHCAVLKNRENTKLRLAVSFSSHILASSLVQYASCNFFPYVKVWMGFSVQCICFCLRRHQGVSRGAVLGPVRAAGKRTDGELLHLRYAGKWARSLSKTCDMYVDLYKAAPSRLGRLHDLQVLCTFEMECTQLMHHTALLPGAEA